MDSIGPSDSYFFNFQMFKNRKGNEHKSEIDFIKESIQIYEQAQEQYERIKKFTDDQLINYIRSENYRGYNDFKKPPSEEIILKDFRYFHNKKSVAASCAVDIKFYRFQLSRLETEFHTKSINPNPHPLIFIGADDTNFQIFERYLQRHLINLYGDISFLYHRMAVEGRLIKVKHLDFIKWMKKQNYIQSTDVDMFDAKESLSNKYSSEQRLNTYYRIVKDITEAK